MFGDFQALYQIELAVEAQAVAKICAYELSPRNEQPVKVDVRPVNAKHVVNSLRLPDSKPTALAAPDIQDASDLQVPLE